MKRNLLFLSKNLLKMALLLLCVSMVAFILVSVSPINPLQANVGQTALGSMSPEQIQKLEEYWGVGQSPVERYLAWAGDVLRGDMGTSLIYRQSVASVIGQRLQNSLWLLVIAWALSGTIGFFLGAVAGANRGGIWDRLIKSYSLITASTPAFWLALLLLLFFSVWLKVLPIGLSVPIGMEASAVTLLDRVRHAILPALTLAITGVSSVALHTREKMIDVMESDYALFARARGDSNWRILRRHGLRNVLLPALTLQFASVGEIIGGSVLIEQVFSYPGLGQAAVAAGLGGDVPLLMGVTLVCAGLVFLGNLAANLLYGVVDPRMKGRESP